MKLKKALFPGSFDPFTKGHEDIVKKALGVFDKIYIAIGINESKKNMFSINKRLEHINKIYKSEDNVEVLKFKGLATNLCKDLKASHIVRGIRSSTDFDYEFKIAQMNKEISNIETIVFFSSLDLLAINSSIIRELIKNGSKIDKFVSNSESLD